VLLHIGLLWAKLKFLIEDNGLIENFQRDSAKRAISMHATPKIDNLLESFNMADIRVASS
jgi:hypothetical protein